MRRRNIAGLALACLGASACSSPSIGVPPPNDQLFFPSGLLLDPRAEPDEAARWLFVANANSDLNYNGGSVAAVDLDAFWRAWFDDSETFQDPRGGADPFCRHEHDHPDGPEHTGRCVQPMGATLDAEHPCRQLTTQPQIVECEERTFVTSAAHIGTFGTVLDYSIEPQGIRLWVPVRGDPSITFIDVAGFDDDDPVDLECGQGLDSDEDDPDRCTDSHRLTRFRNDPDLIKIAREPFNLLVSRQFRYLYVAHGGSGIPGGPGELTLVSLDGIEGDSRPAVVDEDRAFDIFQESNLVEGGFGLAERPCSTDGNAASETKDCTRPLLYAGFRYAFQPSLGGLVNTLTASPITPLPGTASFCATPDELEQPGAIVCDPQLRPGGIIGVGGLDPGFSGGIPVLGDLHFGDARGDLLFAVQTNPGGLIRVNTSLDDNGDPLDVPAGPPIELCQEPTSMAIHVTEQERFAYVSCFRSAFVFVVDLSSFRVVGQLRAGTGPHDLVVDEPRGALYVANTLEANISVIDIHPERATRFTEIARIGLQDVFSR